jgi:hypothetical protein
MLARDVGWPIGIGALLLLTVGANVAMYRIANDDPAFAIEPDYYRKAVAWDSTMARQTESATLAWTAAPTLTAPTPAGTRTLTVDLRDAGAAPLTGAAVGAQLFAIARSQQRDSVSLAEVAPGRYVATVPASRAGLWEVQLSVVRDGHRWASVSRLDVK